MLIHTFQHIAGIGAATERRLWQHGVLTWDALIADPSATPRVRTLEPVAEVLDASRRALASRDGTFFVTRLRSSERWRLYPSFADSVAFFDIETTGLDMHHDVITTIALFDGREVHTFVRGRNLDAFPEQVLRYKLLVTYNGATFDVPFVERAFPGLRLNQAHIDLRYVLAALGFRGGLKGCERQMGLRRAPGLEEVDGFLAVLLWHAHERGDARAMPALLRYNIEDAVNLRWLMETAYNLAIQRIAAPADSIPVSVAPALDWPHDPGIIAELLRV
ncbi:MAG: ribonuclease H-like domain-containing protein [Phycisphaerae bacterium]|nr:ribonuclease H-like domain-containing protein [Phycisphaerae bacterium]